HRADDALLGEEVRFQALDVEQPLGHERSLSAACRDVAAQGVDPIVHSVLRRPARLAAPVLAVTTRSRGTRRPDASGWPRPRRSNPAAARCPPSGRAPRAPPASARTP